MLAEKLRRQSSDGPLVRDIKTTLERGLAPSIREAPLQCFDSISEIEDRLGAGADAILKSGETFLVREVVNNRRDATAADGLGSRAHSLIQKLLPDFVAKQGHWCSIFSRLLPSIKSLYRERPIANPEM